MNQRKRTSVCYRLGIDLGSASIGWAVLRLDENDAPAYLIRLGARVFSDGRDRKKGSSLAVDRRLARQQRRRRDRMLRRKRRIIEALSEFGLWPQTADERLALQNLNPYELRARGLAEKLSCHELGRAIFHLNQRRGFRSSRKADKAADPENGLISSAIQSLQQQLTDSGCETVGAYLHRRLMNGEGTRARRFGEGAKTRYDFYVDRSMIAAEFDLIWSRQAPLHDGALPETARFGLRDVLLYQRPLKPVRPGRCSLEPQENRAALALPSVQRCRILQEVNHLRVRDHSTATERALAEAERDPILDRPAARLADQELRSLRNAVEVLRARPAEISRSGIEISQELQRRPHLLPERD